MRNVVGQSVLVLLLGGVDLAYDVGMCTREFGAGQARNQAGTDLSLVGRGLENGWDFLEQPCKVPG